MFKPRKNVGSVGSILGQSYYANYIINADIENTIRPKFSEFRIKVK